MSKRLIVSFKVILHLLLLAPTAYLVWIYRNGTLAANADPVNYLTHFTGNWALWILLGSLAITPIRRLSPKISSLIRFRRMVGLYAFFYALLHLSTYVFLFSGYDLPTALSSLRAGHPGELVMEWKAVWPTIWDDLLKRRFIQVGVASFVILLALAVTSPARVLRLMGGKNWQGLHRLVYLAAILAIVHYWWLVKAGVRSPATDTVILAVLLAARVAYLGMKRRPKPAQAPASVAKGARAVVR
jgi:sulfoxide reductase heme-binding subunit YedZ